MAHRNAISPESIGLRVGARCRTAGLGREELATIAGVSATWYTWLEQGRDIEVSADTLKRIAGALRLTPTDTAYLFSLAHVAQAKPPVLEHRIGWQQNLQPLPDVFHGPAFIVDAGWALYVDWEVSPRDRRNPARCLCAQYGHFRFEIVLRSFLESSAKFRTPWAAPHTASLAPEPIRLAIPRFGEVALSSTRLSVPGRDDDLIIFLPLADKASAAVMNRLSKDDEP